MNPAETYTPPVDQLLRLGDVRDDPGWQDYRALGLDESHVPELVRLLDDRSLMADEAGDEWWAHIHAWRAAGQLGAVAALPAMLELGRHLQEEQECDDWSVDDLPAAIGLIGEPALEPLAAFLADESKGEHARRVVAVNGLVQIATWHPSLRERVITRLSEQLAKYQTNPPDLNTSLVAELLELDDKTAAPLIKACYASGRIDPDMSGQWASVRDELGLPPSPDDPPLLPSKLGELREQMLQLTSTAPQLPNPFRGRSDFNKLRKKRKQQRQNKKKNRRP